MVNRKSTDNQLGTYVDVPWYTLLTINNSTLFTMIGLKPAENGVSAV
jgi:hypothetical protein